MDVGLPYVGVQQLITPQALGEQTPWSLSDYNVPALMAKSKGKGARVGIIDTGVDKEHLEDGDLAGRVKEAKDFSGSRYGWEDRNGHGTHTLGTMAANAGNNKGILGPACEAEFFVAKALGDRGNGTDKGIHDAVIWLVDDCNVGWINLSLGAESNSPLIEAAVNYAASKNVALICAAGNSGGKVNWPAHLASSIGVGAVDRDRKVAWFSCRGPENDICGPGVGIISLYLDGGYAELDGTSMAAPWVTSILVLADVMGDLKDRSAKSIREYFAKVAIDEGSPGKDYQYGYGLVNPDLIGVHGGGQVSDDEVRIGPLSFHSPARSTDAIGISFSFN